MHILVINGSPKGKYSVTLQTVLYLEKHFPKHTFEIFHAGQKTRLLERDFTQAREALERAELILFSYPVYTFLAPSQLHRFLELLKESGMDLSGRFVTQITTSKHFYDVTAHRYIQDNCQELGMKFIQGLSADMDDLLTEKGQGEAKRFFRYVLWCVKHDSYEPFLKTRDAYAPVSAHMPEKARQDAKGAGAPGGCPVTGEPDKSPVVRKAGANGTTRPGAGARRPVVIVTDCRPEDEQLKGMIARFRAVLPLPSRVVNIREYPFRGGCLGCFHCAVSGKCVYTDGFDEFLRNEIQKGLAIVYAFAIQDHSMGAVFKQYDDRQFCNGHRTVTMGMPMGYLVSGNYAQETNLQMVVEARAQVGGNFLAGVATDEQDTDRAIDRLADTLAYALKHHYTQPQNFYGVGGMKIFRDLIYLMQGMMKADHQFYKQHGQYDFPQKKKGTILAMYLVGGVMSSPKIKSRIGNKMNEGMLMPYKKVLEKK